MMGGYGQPKVTVMSISRRVDIGAAQQFVQAWIEDKPGRSVRWSYDQEIFATKVTLRSEMFESSRWISDEEAANMIVNAFKEHIISMIQEIEPLERRQERHLG